MQDQFDLFFAAFPDASDTTSDQAGHEPLVTPVAQAPNTSSALTIADIDISELVVGEPARRKGYQAKCGGIWFLSIVSASGFDHLSVGAKADMRDRLFERIKERAGL